MIDPASVAHIAQMDQMQMAFRTWAETLKLAQAELMRVGVGEETAYDTAREWISLVIQACEVRDD